MQKRNYKESYLPGIKQLDQIYCNASPKSNHHIFGLMKITVEVSPLFHFLETANKWTTSIIEGTQGYSFSTKTAT